MVLVIFGLLLISHQLNCNQKKRTLIISLESKITILRLGFILLWVLFFSPFWVSGQLSFSFQPIDINGLQTNVVTSVAQDDQGYIWMGTNNGIQCYDMYEVIDERRIDGYDRIYIDKHGRKWMSGSSGIAVYDKRSGKTKRLKVVNDSSTYSATFLHWIYEDSDQRIWVRIVFVNGETRYYYFNESKGQFFAYDSILPSTTRIITIIHDSGDGNFWIGTREGLMYYDLEANRYWYPGDTKFPLANFPGAFEPIHSLYSDRKGNVIVVTWSSKPWSSPHVYIVAKKEPILLDYLFPGDIRSVVADSSDNVWLAGEHLLRIDGKSRLVQEVALPANAGITNEILYDREGNIWLGTQHGIFVFDPKQRFEDLENVSADGVKYRGETLSLLCTSDSIIVVGTWEGDHLYFYDKDFKQLPGIDSFTKKEFASTVRVAIWSLLESSDRSIWIGGQHGNLFRVNRRSKKIERFDDQIFKQQTIRAIFEDSQRNIWFSTQSGLILKRDGRSGVISEIGSYGFGFALFFDDSPFLWASSGTNLLKINPDNGGIVEKHTMKPPKPRDNVIVQLYKIIEVKKDKVILNTSEGLVEFNKKTKEFDLQHLRSGYFKPGTVVKNYLNIETIGEGRYVASLGDGTIVKNENQSVTALVTRNFFVSNSSAKLPDGRIIFGSETGFTVVKPSFMTRSLSPFRAPSINNIFLQNRVVNVDSIMHFGLTLNYNQNYFSVSYSALLLRERENIHYFYRIDKSTDYVNNGHSRTISYGGLPAGKHQLEIYFSTPEVKSPLTSISIEVIPPFWATWWFILISIGVTISIFIVIYRIRISKIKELAMVREKIARDIHDEMGSNISTISILSNVLKDKLIQIGAFGKEVQIIEKISRLSTEAMEAASEIVWSVNPKNDSMEEIARRMRLIGSQLEDFGINFSFIVEGDVSGRELKPDIRNNFYLIYKEIITNIGKHSKCKNVSVRISFAGEFGE